MEKAPMNQINALRRSDSLCITPAQAAEVLGMHPQTIRVQAANNPGALGFPVIRAGSKTLIPRLPFLAYLGMINTGGDKQL